MRELSVVELDLVVGGLYMYDTIGEEGGSYSYGSSSLVDLQNGTGEWGGVAYEADSQALQAEAQAQAIDWRVEGQVGNGGWSVKASVGGKS
jgi:hypothetical protein